ncbi:MAG: phage tail assembly protein, partial [Hyphomonadaceae bacterium]|nr:phage tail assembly protein [Hyphomonadaceae bacterium]
LETPIPRAGGDLTTLRLRRPQSGDLRGLSIAALGQLDYNELRKLLPRISLDMLIVEEVDRIDLADMIEVSGAISDFLFTKRRAAEFRAM